MRGKTRKLPCDQDCENCSYADCILTDEDIVLAIALEDVSRTKCSDAYKKQSREYYHTVRKKKLELETPEEREARLKHAREKRAEWRKNNPERYRLNVIRQAERQKKKREAARNERKKNASVV